MIAPRAYETARRARPAAHAAPEGGARRSRRSRGCGIALAVLVGVGATCANAQAAAQRVEVPSGREVALHEVLIDDAPGARWVRFRFVAPRINEAGAREAVGADMDHLCAQFALPYLDEQGIEAARIVISLSERPVPFGQAAPDITQLFEQYRPEGGACIWDGF